MGLITIKVEADLHKQLKIQAVETGEPLHRIVTLALEQYIRSLQSKQKQA
jgi:predicted transcriptional regulator